VDGGTRLRSKIAPALIVADSGALRPWDPRVDSGSTIRLSAGNRVRGSTTDIFWITAATLFFYLSGGYNQKIICGGAFMAPRNPTYLPMGAPEGTGISSNLVLELLHGPEAQWSPVGEGVPEMTRLEKIPWEGEFTLRSDS